MVRPPGWEDYADRKARQGTCTIILYGEETQVGRRVRASAMRRPPLVAKRMGVAAENCGSRILATGTDPDLVSPSSFNGANNGPRDMADDPLRTTFQGDGNRMSDPGRSRKNAQKPDLARFLSV
jgi:hypothetical protein